MTVYPLDVTVYPLNVTVYPLNIINRREARLRVHPAEQLDRVEEERRVGPLDESAVALAARKVSGWRAQKMQGGPCIPVGTQL